MAQSKLVECIPNISAGVNRDTVAAILGDLEKTNVMILHVDPGSDANRTVITFVGEPSAVLEGSFRLVESALRHIDMQTHRGEHPRIGAVDVLPFVPLGTSTIEECVQLSRELGSRVGSELKVPVYLYEASSQAPHRKNLADVRRGGYEGLEHKLLDEQWIPDFGPRAFNPRFGALVTGAREFLAAFNVNLSGAELPTARKIAAMVRQRGGGPGPHLAGVKAIGWWMEQYGCCQVSMNLTQLGVTGLAQAYEACRECARLLGVNVAGSELIGLIPRQALLDAGRYYQSSQELTSQELVKLAVENLGLDALGEFDPQFRILESVIESKSK